MKRIPWFEILLVVVVMSMSLYAALSDGQNLSWRWFIRDDAYYYFKVAQNISEGHGSTFDGINKTNGYHPLWMLICIPIFALARFDLILPLRILLLVLSGLSAATAVLLYRLIGRIFFPALGAAAALYWAFNPEIIGVVYKQGLETGIAAFFIVLFVYKLYEFEISWRRNEVTQRQIIVLAIIAVLTMFSRLDLVFLVGMVGIWVIFRNSPIRYYLPLDIAAIAAFSILAFLTRNPFLGYYEHGDLALALAGISVVVKVICAYLFGLYQGSVLAKPVELLKRIFLFAITSSVISGALMLGIIRVGLLQGSFSRMILIIDLAFTVVVFGINRLLFTGLHTRSTEQMDESPLSLLRSNWKQWLYEGAIYFGIVLGSLGLYMVWNKIAFGTSSPVSGQIKRWWASLPGRAYGGPAADILSFFGLSYTQGDANSWKPISSIFGDWAERIRIGGLIDWWRYFVLLAIFAIVFYLLFFINRKKAKTSLIQLSIVPLFASTWLQVLSYHATGYAAYKDWYWITQLIVVILTCSFILGMLVTPLRKIPKAHWVAWALVAWMAFDLSTTHWRSIRASMEYNVWAADAPYFDIVPLLEANTEPGSIIGVTGGGNLGYFIHGRTIVNMDGLINSHPYFEALQKREAGRFLLDLGLDYVLANPYILSQQPYKGQYDAYMDVTEIRYGGKLLMRYGQP